MAKTKNDQQDDSVVDLEAPSLSEAPPPSPPPTTEVVTMTINTALARTTSSSSSAGYHHDRQVSEVTFVGDSSSTPHYSPYTVGDMTGLNQERLAEDDTLRTLEPRTSQPGTMLSNNANNKSSRLILFPEIPDESVIDFEEMEEEELKLEESRTKPSGVDGNDDDDDGAISAPTTPREADTTTAPSIRGRVTLAKTNGLRDLTAQLISAARESNGNNSNNAMNNNWNALVGGGERMGMNGATRGTAADRMAEKAAAMFASMGELPPGVPASNTTSTSSGQQPGRVDEPNNNNNNNNNRHKRRFRRTIQTSREKLKMNQELFVDYFRPQKKVIGHYWWIRLKFIILPGLITATILFYVGKNPNPPHGQLTGDESGNGTFVNDKGIVPETASVSWWILFVVRQSVTLSSAKMWEMFMIDFLAMKTGILRAIVGPYVSLWLVQSQGWPFQAVIWGLANQIFLAGTSDFVNHWLFFQESIGVFNRENASGNVLDHPTYRAFLICTIVFGAATAVKRVVLSNVIGKRLVVNYGTQLETLMEKVILLTQIAALAKRLSGVNHRDVMSTRLEIADPEVISPSGSQGQDKPSTFGSFQFGSSGRLGTVVSLLGEWNEPEQVGEQSSSQVTIASLLHFRRALAFIDAEYPFSFAFGLAKTRTDCVESAQRLFTQLALDEETMTFDVLAPLVFTRGETFNKEKMRKLCRLLRPTKEGTLSRIDFLRSVDNVYKELRTLVASIENSSQIERNYETIVNIIHYFSLCAGGAIFLGIDFQQMLVSISALFIGIGFIIGGACANFLEGLLMVFVRRPFDVGDRVSIQEVSDIPDPVGSPAWIVEKVDLYATTLRYAATREVASVTNGELARKRIINMQRSKKAIVFIDINFGMDVNNTQVDQLRNAAQEYVKNRPREWVSMSAFRMTEIHANQGFVAYRAVLQHQDSWQNVGVVLASKADVGAFILDMSKTLKMGYTAPSVPVEMTFKPSPDIVGVSDDDEAETPLSIKSLRSLFGESKKIK